MSNLREVHPETPDRDTLQLGFEQYLRKLGLRQTNQRRVILDAVLQLGPHVDAETIAAKARELDQSIGLATVYRTLQLMTDAGLVVERQFGRERKQFEFADAADVHHDHLICNNCGEIIEFYEEQIEKIQEDIAERLGFRLKRHKMELYADCRMWPSCPRKNAPEGKG